MRMSKNISLIYLKRLYFTIYLNPIKLSMQEIKKIPVAMGEPDPLKSILTLPGVTNAGEASSGFNVRGGAADQNLVLLDGAPVFGDSHMFGFFSIFSDI